MIIWKPGMTLEVAERQVLWQALTHYCGNKAKAARALGISLTTIRAKCRQYSELSKFQGSPDKRNCVCGRGCGGRE